VAQYSDAVGRAIRQLRKARGLSQEELAYRAGVHRTYVGGVERGERNVTVDSLHKFATGLGVQASEILKVADAED
jgi:transcriptional regulator with XRE-family HTH domain